MTGPEAPHGPDGRIPAALVGRIVSLGLDVADVTRVVEEALAEDLGDGPDATTRATIAAAEHGEADIVTRAAGVVAGLAVAEVVFVLASGDWQAGRAVRPPEPDGENRGTHARAALTVRYRAADGDRVVAGQVLMTVSGSLRLILTAERTALNLLTHLSGVATVTRRWADAVDGTGARIRDTRKTLPGLRLLEKYAVRCGGGINHRMSLSDAALIKDNHVAAAGSVTAAYEAVRRAVPGLPVEVECDTPDQVAEAVATGARSILLDNFTVPQMRVAVAAAGGRAVLEASGGLSLENAAQVAATGVDYLAVGALTHSAPALDIGLDLVRAG